MNFSFSNRSLWFGIILGGFLGLVPGFGLGVYFLPILVEEAGASQAELDKLADLMKQNTAKAQSISIRKGTFRRDLKGSDGLHWGEGEIILSKEADGTYITLIGSVSPGPDYRLYLIPRFVETERAFLSIKGRSVRVASVKAYTNFRYKIPSSIDSDKYSAVLVWCERFEEFITAAKLQ
jgi:hypothetical protein